MKTHEHSVLVSIALLLVSTLVHADNLSGKALLLTAKDRVSDNSFSNITVQNNTGAPITAYGLYVNQLAVTDTTCAASTILYPVGGTPPNQAAGAFVTVIPFASNQKIPIGENFLYNMLYTAIYYNNQVGPSSPCTLPGCGWFTDTPPQKWCVYMGVLSPGSGNTVGAKVPPYGTPTSGSGYNYGMVTQYEYIGPISCNDKTQTCSVPTAQNVAFPK